MTSEQARKALFVIMEHVLAYESQDYVQRLSVTSLLTVGATKGPPKAAIEYVEMAIPWVLLPNMLLMTAAPQVSGAAPKTPPKKRYEDRYSFANDVLCGFVM